MKTQSLDWISKLTDTSNKLEVEAFKKTEKEKKEEEFNVSLSLIDREKDDKYILSNKTNLNKTNVACRIDTCIINEIDNMTDSSRNSAINALLHYAIRDLKEKNKMLIFK